MSTILVMSEIAGTVIKVEKQPGDEVSTDDTLVLIECMKMEIPILAPVDGRLVSLDVKEGETIGEGRQVATIESRT